MGISGSYSSYSPGRPQALLAAGLAGNYGILHAMQDETLTRRHDDLSVDSRTLPIFVGDIGARPTVIRPRHGDETGSRLRSPGALDGDLRAAVTLQRFAPVPRLLDA